MTWEGKAGLTNDSHGDWEKLTDRDREEVRRRVMAWDPVLTAESAGTFGWWITPHAVVPLDPPLAVEAGDRLRAEANADGLFHRLVKVA